MTHVLPPGLVLGLVVFLEASLPRAAFAASACDSFGSEDAATLVGGPVPANERAEMKPTAENGYDHTTVCGWFPQGYKLATANAPPPHGAQLTLHEMRTPAEAQAFHENITSMMEEVAKASPQAGTFTPASGLGDAAVLQQQKLGGVHLATVRFLKGKVAAQLQVWRAEGPPGDAAVAAARRIVVR
jgi:hypothetical protein